MLTGDKVDTAKCIAVATGMSQKDQEVFEITSDAFPIDSDIRNEI